MHTTTDNQGVIWRIAGVAMLLAAADSTLTWIWLQQGTAEEANPWLAGVLDLFGVTPGLMLRTVWVVGLIAALALLVDRARLARAGLWVALVSSAAAVAWHVVGALAR